MDWNTGIYVMGPNANVNNYPYFEVTFGNHGPSGLEWNSLMLIKTSNLKPNLIWKFMEDGQEQNLKSHLELILNLFIYFYRISFNF